MEIVTKDGVTYANRITSGSHIQKKTGLINLSVAELEEVLADAKNKGNNRVCVSFKLRKDGMKGNTDDAREDFPTKTFIGEVGLSTSKRV